MGLAGKSAIRGIFEAVAPVVLFQLSGFPLFLGFAASASSRPSAWCFLLAVISVVLLRFSGLSLFLGFTVAASFRFLLAGVFFRFKGTHSGSAVYFSVLPLVLWL